MEMERKTSRNPGVPVTSQTDAGDGDGHAIMEISDDQIAAKFGRVYDQPPEVDNDGDAAESQDWGSYRSSLPKRHLTEWYLTRRDALDENSNSKRKRRRYPLPDDGRFSSNEFELHGLLVSLASCPAEGDRDFEKGRQPVVIRDLQSWFFERTHAFRGIWVKSLWASYKLLQPCSRPISLTVTIRRPKRMPGRPMALKPLGATLPSQETLHLPLRAQAGLVSNVIDVMAEPCPKSTMDYVAVHARRSPMNVHSLLRLRDEGLNGYGRAEDMTLNQVPFDLELLKRCPDFVRRHVVQFHLLLHENCVFIRALGKMAEAQNTIDVGWDDDAYRRSAAEAEERSQRTPWGDLIDNARELRPNRLIEMEIEKETRSAATIVVSEQVLRDARKRAAAATAMSSASSANTPRMNKKRRRIRDTEEEGEIVSGLPTAMASETGKQTISRALPLQSELKNNAGSAAAAASADTSRLTVPKNNKRQKRTAETDTEEGEIMGGLEKATTSVSELGTSTTPRDMPLRGKTETVGLSTLPTIPRKKRQRAVDTEVDGKAVTDLTSKAAQSQGMLESMSPLRKGAATHQPEYSFPLGNRAEDHTVTNQCPPAIADTTQFETPLPRSESARCQAGAALGPQVVTPKKADNADPAVARGGIQKHGQSAETPLAQPEGSSLAGVPKSSPNASTTRKGKMAIRVLTISRNPWNSPYSPGLMIDALRSLSPYLVPVPTERDLLRNVDYKQYSVRDDEAEHFVDKVLLCNPVKSMELMLLCIECLKNSGEAVLERVLVGRVDPSRPTGAQALFVGWMQYATSRIEQGANVAESDKIGESGRAPIKKTELSIILSLLSLLRLMCNSKILTDYTSSLLNSQGVDVRDIIAQALLLASKHRLEELEKAAFYLSKACQDRTQSVKDALCFAGEIEGLVEQEGKSGENSIKDSDICGQLGATLTRNDTTSCMMSPDREHASPKAKSLDANATDTANDLQNEAQPVDVCARDKEEEKGRSAKRSGDDLLKREDKHCYSSGRHVPRKEFIDEAKTVNLPPASEMIERVNTSASNEEAEKDEIKERGKGDSSRREDKSNGQDAPRNESNDEARTVDTPVNETTEQRCAVPKCQTQKGNGGGMEKAHPALSYALEARDAGQDKPQDTSLLEILERDWMVAPTKRRCECFSETNKCSSGANCRFVHVFQTKLLSEEIRAASAFELFCAYTDEMECPIKTKDFHTKIERDKAGGQWLAAAFVCPVEGTIYYAEGGLSRESVQGIHWYPNSSAAVDAIAGVVLSALRCRKRVRRLWDLAAPEKKSTCACLDMENINASLPELSHKDWGVVSGELCKDFSEKNSCDLRQKCRHPHVFRTKSMSIDAHSGFELFCAYAARDEFPPLGESDFRIKNSERDEHGRVWYTVAFVCPLVRTVYYAESGHSHTSPQGIHWYSTFEDAFDAVASVVMSALRDRELLKRGQHVYKDITESEVLEEAGNDDRKVVACEYLIGPAQPDLTEIVEKKGQTSSSEMCKVSLSVPHGTKGSSQMSKSPVIAAAEHDSFSSESALMKNKDVDANTCHKKIMESTGGSPPGISLGARGTTTQLNGRGSNSHDYVDHNSDKGEYDGSSISSKGTDVQQIVSPGSSHTEGNANPSGLEGKERKNAPLQVNRNSSEKDGASCTEAKTQDGTAKSSSQAEKTCSVVALPIGKTSRMLGKASPCSAKVKLPNAPVDSIQLKESYPPDAVADSRSSHNKCEQNAIAAGSTTSNEASTDKRSGKTDSIGPEKVSRKLILQSKEGGLPSWLSKNPPLRWAGLNAKSIINPSSGNKGSTLSGSGRTEDDSEILDRWDAWGRCRLDGLEWGSRMNDLGKRSSNPQLDSFIGYDKKLGRIYFSSFCLHGSKYHVGDYISFGSNERTEVNRIIGVYQATKSFLGCRVQLQKRGHPYAIVVPLFSRKLFNKLRIGKRGASKKRWQEVFGDRGSTSIMRKCYEEEDELFLCDDDGDLSPRHVRAIPQRIGAFTKVQVHICHIGNAGQLTDKVFGKMPSVAGEKKKSRHHGGQNETGSVPKSFYCSHVLNVTKDQKPHLTRINDAQFSLLTESCPESMARFIPHEWCASLESEQVQMTHKVKEEQDSFAEGSLVKQQLVEVDLSSDDSDGFDDKE